MNRISIFNWIMKIMRFELLVCPCLNSVSLVQPLVYMSYIIKVRVKQFFSFSLLENLACSRRWKCLSCIQKMFPQTIFRESSILAKCCRYLFTFIWLCKDLKNLKSKCKAPRAKLFIFILSLYLRKLKIPMMVILYIFFPYLVIYIYSLRKP